MLHPEHVKAQQQRILVFSDGEPPATFLAALQGQNWVRCHSVADIDREVRAGAGLLLLMNPIPTAEATMLEELLERQPVWSDLAVVMVVKTWPTGTGTSVEIGKNHAIVLEETISAHSLATILQSILRDRARQYQLGQHSEGMAQLAELKETIRSLDGFCHTVAHDLRAPLRAMQGLSTALLEDYEKELEGDGLDYARRIVTAAARMDRLIQDLLAYSRLDRLEIVPVDLNLDVIVDMILVAQSGEIKSSRAEVKVERPLPPLRSSQIIVEQVISHVVSNALKFVRPDDAPQVRIRAEPTSGAVRLWVEDNGIGIEPRNHERIFNVFERLHGEETFPGTGIGLALVRKGLKRLGGRAGVRSELGKGSSFWVEFPQIHRHTAS